MARCLTRLRTRCAATLGAAVLLLPIADACAESLGEALDRYGIRPPALPAGHALDDPITSYATLTEPDYFVIAYYHDDGSGALHSPLKLLRRDTSSGRWRGAAVDELVLGPDYEHCFGSAIGSRAVRQTIYITTHVSPSASCTLVFSPALFFQSALYGWYLAAFSDGTVVYHNSQVHFAPTHPAVLSVFDPATGESRQIYPLRPYQAIRAEHIRKLQSVYDDPAWCNRRNHHCDPDLFDNRISGDVVVGDATDSLAFIASFSNDELTRSAEERLAPTEVLYVYRHVREPPQIEYREILLDDFRAQFGDLGIDAALSPSILEQLFAD